MNQQQSRHAMEQEHGALDEQRTRARRRARRAAQVVTIGLALAGGCSQHHVQHRSQDGDHRVADAEMSNTADATVSRDAQLRGDAHPSNKSDRRA